MDTRPPGKEIQTNNLSVSVGKLIFPVPSFSYYYVLSDPLLPMMRRSSRKKKKPDFTSYDHLMACDKIRSCRKKAKERERAKEGMKKIRLKRTISKLKIKLKSQKKKK